LQTKLRRRRETKVSGLTPLRRLWEIPRAVFADLRMPSGFQSPEVPASGLSLFGLRALLSSGRESAE
jgi:hypothetical protein